MHPAYSVIVFTTASGAGYGLLIWLALATLLDLVPRDRLLGFVGFGVALALVTIGLLTSTFHLGRPERAWRALSQWRSSWLSREGVAAIVTYGPAGLLGLGWVFGIFGSGTVVAAASLAMACALVTLWCTGMIYASLPTVRAWNQALVPPIYVALALATGGVLLTLLLAGFGYAPGWAAGVSAVALAAGWLLKARYWSVIDSMEKTRSAESATGLVGLSAELGAVRPLDPPHTQPNYVMREMGYRVARRHARKLRLLSVLLLFLLPTVAALVMVAGLSRPLDLVVASLSTISAALGVLVERWLFFAEAEHVVVVYYRGGSA